MTDMTRPGRAGCASEAGKSFSSRNAPTRKPPIQRSQAESRRKSLPQCIVTCRDGRELLLDARGFPMFERRPGKPAKAADALEHLVGVTDRDFIYQPPASPRTDPDVRRRCLAVLAQWGIPT